MAAVKTLSVEVAVVDAAVCGHEDVRQTAGRVGPVHHTEGEGRARPGIQPVRVRGERDGVSVTTSPPSASLPGQDVTTGARHRVAAASCGTARVGGDHVAVGGRLLHGQTGGGGGGGGRRAGGATRR